MRKFSFVIATALATLVVAAPAVVFAAGANKPAGYLYRYKNEKGVMVIDSSVPPEIVKQGYQIITRSGQVVEDVAPSSAPVLTAEQEREKREQETAQLKRDIELRKLYSAPQDAERQRDRQIEAIKLKIDFAKGQLLQTTNKRKAELENAARMERKGTPVPKETKDNITRLNTQVAAREAEIKQMEADIERVHTDFEPVIERLKVIYPHKVKPGEAAATPATPAVPGAASAVPATPAKPAAPAQGR